ncbi:MAG: beta-galactosidase, partial [Kiritimatiellae bacterium]|nr:beta-galactosidase [Kiritimatiellia bacterium]
IPLRVLDERHMRYAERWYRKVAEVIVPHQITHGGNIICIQVENEYDHLIRMGEEKITEDDARAYFKQLRGFMEKYGIDIPKFANEAEFLHGTGIIDTRTYYPNIPWIWLYNFKYFDGKIVKAQKGQPDCPTMILELQSGWFSQCGQPFYIPEVELTEGVSKSVLMYGASLLNYYMFVGGTTPLFWGCRGDRSAHPVGQLESWAKPIGITTTYDFGGSAVREWGELMPGRYSFLRAFTLFARDYTDFLVGSSNTDAYGVLSGGEKVQQIRADRSEPDTSLQTEAENFTIIARKRGGETLLCVRNLDTAPKTVTVGLVKSRQPVFKGLTVGPRETRLLPVNVVVPRAGIRIARSTSELLFAKKVDGMVMFGLYGTAGRGGETVLDVPAAQVKVLSGQVKVSGGKQAVLRYVHSGLHIVRVKQHVLVILERELAGKVDELSHGLLVGDAYYIRDIRQGRKAVAIEASLKRGSKNALHYVGRLALSSARVDGKAASVKRDRKAGLATVSLRAPAARGIRMAWVGDWKARTDTEEVGADYRDRDWKMLSGPVPLENAGLIQHGYTWYRAEFDLPAGARDVGVFYKGNDIDMQQVFFNGRRVWSGITAGHTIWAQGALKRGRNVVSVLYSNFFHNKAHPSEGPIQKRSGIMGPLMVQGTRGGKPFKRKVTQFRVREQLTGNLRGYAEPAYDDSGWMTVPAGRRYIMDKDAGWMVWLRRKFTYTCEPGWTGAVKLTIPDAKDRCLLYINGKPLGQFEGVGPQHEFYVPETFLRAENVLTVLLEGERGWLIQPKLDTYYEARDVAVEMRFR